MLTSRRLFGLALASTAMLGGVGGVNAATLHNVNAAEIGTGVPRALNWADEAAQSPIWCGTACDYSKVSTAKIAPDSLWTYTPAAWPDNDVTPIPNPSAVYRSTPTPTGTTDSQGREILYDSPYYERGAVIGTRVGDYSLTTSVHQSGNQSSGPGKGAAALSYRVKAQNQSSGARDYFIRFTAPKRVAGVSPPYYYGGPSGNQPFNVNQNKYVKTRSAVDVLVNGLPVWSTSAGYFLPEEASSSTDYSGYPIDFGYESDDDTYTVFIGRYASAAFFEIDFIVRAESVSKGAACGTVSDPMTHPNPKSRKHCLLVSEGRTLLEAPNQDVFLIYSKVVSTPIYEIAPGVIGPLSTDIVSTQD